MSFDRQIDQVCTHAVSEEALFVSSDRRTVRPLRPISSANSVKVWMNNAYPVPSDGSYVAAKSSGTRRGPFSFVTGVSDTLVLTVNQGNPQTVVLPALNQISPRRLAALLNQQFTGVTFSVINDRISFASQEKGAGASIFLGAASTASTVLGLTPNREFRGQCTTPGWTLVSDPSTLSDRPTRLIVFDEALKSASDFVEISYVTLREECRRCGGSGFENDWRFDRHGEVIEIRDEGLLIQELQKDFYTLRGSNQFHTWYGTSLIDSIGKKLSAGFAQNLVVADIYQAFGRWQSIKRQQEQDVGQEVSDREYPFRLLSVNFEQSTQDPTVVFVNCVVQNRSNDPIQLTRGLRLPGLNANATGTIRQSLSGSFVRSS